MGPSVLAACPLTCQACDDMISFDQIETSFVHHLESRPEQEPQLPIKLENPASAMEHLSSFINSFTATFEDRESTPIIGDEEIEAAESEVVTFGCVDVDPRCDTYTEFCEQDNIKLLCPLTCQVDGCKTTTSSTVSTTASTTTPKPNTTETIQSGDGSGDFELEFGSGMEEAEFGSGEVEVTTLTETVLVGNDGGAAVELIAARHQCESTNSQVIRLEADKTHMMYFADEYFAASDCDFVLQRDNDDVVIIDINIIDVRTTQNCDRYVDVYSDDTPI